MTQSWIDGRNSPWHRGHESYSPFTPQLVFAPAVVETKAPENSVNRVAAEIQATLFLHLAASTGSNVVHSGCSPRSLAAASQSHIRLSMKARAEPRCKATLQCSLSILTVSQPTAPCQTIRATATLEASLASEPNSSPRLTSSQLRSTSGPRTAPASSLWAHSVNI